MTTSIATTHYFDRTFGLDAVKIMPGEFCVAEDGEVLVTVLGSCVAACLRDPLTGIGGMNHFMLPDAAPEVISPSARYGTQAMELLINQLVRVGARRGRLEAKVFGGGAVLKGLEIAQIGQRNADFVLRFLQTENIPVIAKDLLDSYPRKVYFFPETGRVLVRKLHRVHNETLFERERLYRQRLDQEPLTGSVELFS